jgi:uncharacterized MAPEG superfamily protein
MGLLATCAACGSRFIYRKGLAESGRAIAGRKLPMTPELTYLVLSVALTFILVLIAVSGATLQVGLPKLIANREGLPEMTGWAGRAARAHRNMLENLILFAVLVLVAHLAGVHNGMTLLGSQLFFWGRTAHALTYIAGIPGLRTAAWGVSVIGLVLIFLQLIPSIS